MLFLWFDFAIALLIAEILVIIITGLANQAIGEAIACWLGRLLNALFSAY
ncbi:MAG TPA: hypothetical protein VLE93_00925 [Candidatus Saccharimonadales bacterium]|nr:hypothetical protein [Candidatus Saccharimonadales bacterium]